MLRKFKIKFLVLLLFVLGAVFACHSLFGNDCGEFSWAPDGKHIAFKTSEGIYVMQTDGSQVRQIDWKTSAKHYTTGVPAWSPNGQQILFTASPENTDPKSIYQMYVVNANGSQGGRVLIDNGFSPQWSPDGRRITFQSYKDDNWEIYMMNSDGSKPVRLTKNKNDDENLMWSPDGKQILFSSLINIDRNEIYVVDSDKLSKPKKLGNGHSAVWSPNGKKIAFLSDTLEVHVMNRDGSSDIQLGHLAIEVCTYCGVQWSPDGQQLLVWFKFNKGTLYDYGIRHQIIDANRPGQIRQLVVSEGSVDPPAWSPNGQNIAFNRSGNIYTINVGNSEIKQIR
jgi:Tol biopolymer transport system component